MCASVASTDAALGFSTLEREITVDELDLSGQLPAWCSGTLLRTGPAKFSVGTDQMRHWFDGFAMLHRFTIADGKVSYGNRFLGSRAYRAAAQSGRITYSEFATDPCRSLFRRVQTLFTRNPPLTDNANVNLLALGDRFIALTETPIPVQFDPQTLNAAEVAPYEVPGMLSTAHPHADRRSGAMLNYAAQLGPRNSYRFFELAPGARKPRVLASLPVREPAYMHSFGLTERFFVLAEFPFVVNPLSLALARRPYIENYRWKPERGTRFTLVDRLSGRTIDGFRGDACFAFHHVNAYEDGSQVIVDVCAYPDATIIEDLYLERLRAGKPVTPAKLTRFTLNLDDRSMSSRTLVDEPVELPRINYGAVNERPYRYLWGNGLDGGWIEQIVKVDIEHAATMRWSQPGCFPGEPVFVARPGGEREDDGVLMSVVLDSAAGHSFLLVLDAGDLSELARASVPHHIPFGFHGQFMRN